MFNIETEVVHPVQMETEDLLGIFNDKGVR